MYDPVHNWLNEQDYNVLLIANAAREGSEKPRNNDLIICTEVYNAVRDKTKVMWSRAKWLPRRYASYWHAAKYW